MCPGGIVFYALRLFVAYRAAQTPQNANVPATITHRENIEIYYIFSFLFYYIIIIYRLLRRHATIADYLTTIRRLFRDCPATIPGTRREPRGNLRAVPERGHAARLGAKPGDRSAGAAAGGAGMEGSRQSPRTCRRGGKCGVISRRRGECLYLRRNCPLNARSCFRSNRICPRCKRAVYARFRGYFATVQKTTPENAGALCGVALYSVAVLGGGYSAQVGGARGAGGSQVLQAVGVSPGGAASHGWSWRHSTEPETEKSPGRLRAYRGGCLLGAFRRVNEYQERHEQNI